jgi:predicted transposase YbfD/YdcC
VLGQVKVAEKSNEVIAIPKLIDMLAIEGARAMWEPSICCDARLESKTIPPT